ncbi:MAG: cupin domain-containing protein [Candidatus Krumholzibacteriota bacterium]|nr:cupin domain-containing protein [Candidatus Krumholzibacteriota bacterium]
MISVNALSAPVMENPHNISASRIYDSQNAQAVHMTLRPGEALKRHITPVEVIFYILEGRGVVEIGEERKEFGPDTLIESPAGIPHCWYNESDMVLRILVIKVPRPVSATKLL